MQIPRFRKIPSGSAFTTIELMVVIAVIAILLGFLFFAGQKLIRSNRVSATRSTLNNLQGMLGELEAADGLQRQPPVWLWPDASGAALQRNLKDTAVGTLSLNFWRMPGVDGTGTFDVLSTPAYIGSDSTHPVDVNQRNGSIAVVNTTLALSMLASVPANKSRLQNMTQDVKFIPEWRSGEIELPQNDRFYRYGNDGSATMQYVPGARVKYQDHFFVATPALLFNQNPAPVLNTNGPWFDETANGTSLPILKDAWGNPIIFVPATGLRVLLKNGRSRFGWEENPRVDYPEQRFIVTSPEGEVINNGTTNTGVSPQVVRPGRPFFASAGPDGDFSTGDDNVYSFEK